MKPTWIFLIFAALISISTSFADALESYSTKCELSLQHLLENKTSCVKEINGDRIYLKTERISISDEGISVLLNDLGDSAFIPMIYTDAAGCFIQVGFANGGALRTGDWGNNYKKTCPGCGWEYFTSCPNPDCKLKKKK